MGQRHEPGGSSEDICSKKARFTSGTPQSDDSITGGYLRSSICNARAGYRRHGRQTVDACKILTEGFSMPEFLVFCDGRSRRELSGLSRRIGETKDFLEKRASDWDGSLWFQEFRFISGYLFVRKRSRVYVRHGIFVRWGRMLFLGRPLDILFAARRRASNIAGQAELTRTDCRS